MKNLIAVVVLALSFASCNSVAKYADSINALSTDWDATTESVTSLVSSVSDATQNWNKMKGEMTLPEGVEASEEDAAKLSSLMQTFTGLGEGFGGMNSDLSAFVNDWTEKAKGLTELKDGLAAGKIEGDVQAKIDGLTGTVEEAKGKVTSWTESLGQMVEQATNTYNQYKGIVDGLMSNAG